MSTQDFINTLEDSKQYTKSDIQKIYNEYSKKGGKGKRVKKEKDPNAPKKEPNNYMNWCNANRAEYKSKNPEAKPTELTKLMGAAWRELSDDEKAKWKSSSSSLDILKKTVEQSIKELSSSSSSSQKSVKDEVKEPEPVNKKNSSKNKAK
jgi:hypothetical protein